MLGTLTPEQQKIAMQGMSALANGSAFAFATNAKLKWKNFETNKELGEFLESFQEKPRLLVSVIPLPQSVISLFMAIYYE